MWSTLLTHERRFAWYPTGLVVNLGFALLAVVLIVWLVVLVDMIRRPARGFPQGAVQKWMWVLIVVWGGPVAAGLWWGVRRSVLEPQPPGDGPTAGWYPDPSSTAGARRWWDGVRWTDYVQR